MGLDLSMSRRMATAWARESRERTFHLFWVTDFAILRVRIVITGGRMVSNSYKQQITKCVRACSGSACSMGSCSSCCPSGAFSASCWACGARWRPGRRRFPFLMIGGGFFPGPRFECRPDRFAVFAWIVSISKGRHYHSGCSLLSLLTSVVTVYEL